MTTALPRIPCQGISSTANPKCSVDSDRAEGGRSSLIDLSIWEMSLFGLRQWGCSSRNVSSPNCSRCPVRHSALSSPHEAARPSRSAIISSSSGWDWLRLNMSCGAQLPVSVKHRQGREARSQMKLEIGRRIAPSDSYDTRGDC